MRPLRWTLAWAAACAAAPSAGAAPLSYTLAPTRIILNGDVLDVDARLDLGGERPRLTGRLSGPRLDIRPWLAEIRPDPAPPPPGSDDRDGASSAVFSDDPLPLEALRLLDASLDLDLGRVVLDRADLQSVRATAELSGGRLRLDPLTAGLGEGRLAGSVEVDAGDARPHMTAMFEGGDLASADLLGLAGYPALVDAPAELRMNLRADGASLEALAGTVSGRVTMLVDQGRLDTGVLDATSDGARLLLATLERGGAPSSRLNCAAFDVAAEQGVLTPELAVLDTEYATLGIEGEVDLGRESLALSILPRAKVLSLDLTAPFLVRGPLAEPRVDVDRAGAAREVAGLLAALAAPPSVERAFDGLDGNRGCLSLDADAASGPGAPAGIEVPDNVEDLIERGVRGLFGR